MSVYWDEGRKNMEDFCRGAKIPSTGQPSPFNYLFQPDPDDLLRVSVALSFRRAKLQYVYLILRGKDLESGDFSEARRDDQFERLKEAQAYALDYQNWHEYFKALQQAGYRRSETISSKVALIYCYTLFLIGKRDFKLDAYELRTLIARWFFMAALTSRYSSSPESQMEGELARLRGLQTAAEFKIANVFHRKKPCTFKLLPDELLLKINNNKENKEEIAKPAETPIEIKPEPVTNEVKEEVEQSEIPEETKESV